MCCSKTIYGMLITFLSMSKSLFPLIPLSMKKREKCQPKVNYIQNSFNIIANYALMKTYFLVTLLMVCRYLEWVCIVIWIYSVSKVYYLILRFMDVDLSNLISPSIKTVCTKPLLHTDSLLPPLPLVRVNTP